MAERVSVSVIIPTKDRSEDLATAVRSVLRQSVLPEQIIIVDQSADERGKELMDAELASAREVRLDYLFDRPLGAAGARNRAIERATGTVWLFLDDDVELESNFIEALLATYAAPAVGGVCGIITNYVPPPLGSRWWAAAFVTGPFNDERQPLYWKADKLRESAPIPVRQFTGALMSFRASLVNGARFDQRLRVGEDSDFCLRLFPEGGLVLQPQARLIHKRSLQGRAHEHWLTAHALTHYYLYGRHWRRGIYNRVCFAWLNVGYAVAALGGCARRGSLESW